VLWTRDFPISDSTDYEHKLSEARKIIASKKIVIFTGMATSLYTADLAAIILSENGYSVFTEDASELLHYKSKMLTEDAVLVAISQSGETAETRKVIENARMPIISVTNNEHSTIARMSDLNLPILAGEEKGSAGKTYIATLVLMLALGYYCTGKDSYFFKYINRVVPLMKEITSYFEDNISDLVYYFDDHPEYIFFIGRGPNVITAQQSALNTIINLCQEAKRYNFRSVAIGPDFVKTAASELINTDVHIVVAVGFPLGYTTTKTKVFEAKEAIENGANEIDMVVNLSAVKDGRWEHVRDDIASVAKNIGDKTLKVIFETCYLDDDEIKKLAELCLEINGVDYIKTSTGFGPASANTHHVRLMKEVAGDKIKVKAAGGINTLDILIKMVESGASRIGTSSGVKIMKEIEIFCKKIDRNMI
jgi:deoxyribose-phosphate aldolase